MEKNQLFDERCKELEAKEKQMNFAERSLESKQKQLADRIREVELKEKQLANTIQIRVGADQSERNSPSLDLGFVVTMFGKGLQLFLNENVKHHDSIAGKVLEALKQCIDPAKFVLDAMDGFYPPHLKKGNFEFEGSVVKRSCILLLEQIMRILPIIRADVKGEALRIAAEWKVKMKPVADNWLEVLGFLSLLAAYELGGDFDVDELLSLYKIVPQQRQTPELFMLLGFTGAEGAPPVSNQANNGSNIGQPQVSQQKQVPMQSCKLGGRSSGQFHSYHLRSEVDSSRKVGSERVTKTGGTTEVGEGVKNQVKGIAHVNTAGDTGVGMSKVDAPKTRVSATSSGKKRKRGRPPKRSHENTVGAQGAPPVANWANNGSDIGQLQVSQQKQVPMQSCKLCGRISGQFHSYNLSRGKKRKRGRPPKSSHENTVEFKKKAVTLCSGGKKSNVIDDSDPEVYECPDPEFSDFGKDKDEKCFSVDQIWACYDTIDGMPRFYAQVKKVFSRVFKLQITWLQADLEEQAEIDWVNEDLPVGCGKFTRGDTEETSDLLSFSHQIHFEKGVGRSSYVIYPRMGETWALFKDWDIGWSSEPENHNKYIFEIVEILSDFSHDTGIKVGYLGKMKGFVSLFKRMTRVGVVSFVIPSGEMLRFSHQIPSFKMTGAEREGVPEGSFELDTAALPTNPNELWQPEEEVEAKSMNVKLNGLSSKPSDEKVKFTISSENASAPMNSLVFDCKNIFDNVGTAADFTPSNVS